MNTALMPAQGIKRAKKTDTSIFLLFFRSLFFRLEVSKCFVLFKERERERERSRVVDEEVGVLGSCA